MKLSLLTRPNLTYLKVELAVAGKAKEMDPFSLDLLAANDKVQSQKETRMVEIASFLVALP